VRELDKIKINDITQDLLYDVGAIALVLVLDFLLWRGGEAENDKDVPAGDTTAGSAVIFFGGEKVLLSFCVASAAFGGDLGNLLGVFAFVVALVLAG
jgi:hypothetical protein